MTSTAIPGATPGLADVTLRAPLRVGQLLRTLAVRLAIAVPTVLLASILIFVMIRLVPGGPAQGILGQQATPDAIAALNKEMGLDHPLVYQYWHWLSGAVQGNLGDSLQTHQPVSHMIGQALPVTLELVLLGLLFTLLFAVPAGVVIGYREGSRLDRVVTTSSGLGLAVPDFFLAIILIAVFATTAHIFPGLGFVPISDNLGENLYHLVLPTAALGLGASSIVVRQVRSEVAAAMNSTHVIAARAMGIAEGRLLWRYAMRTAMPTVLTVYGLLGVAMLGSTLIFEQVFVLPGIGNSLINAVGYRDYTLIEGIASTYVVIVIVVNLLVDVAITALSPEVSER